MNSACCDLSADMSAAEIFFEEQEEEKKKDTITSSKTDVCMRWFDSCMHACDQASKQPLLLRIKDDRWDGMGWDEEDPSSKVRTDCSSRNSRNSSWTADRTG